MRLLLDTHVALWALVGSERLGAVARGLLADPANEVFVSAASIWEVSLKFSLGRGDVPIDGPQFATWCATAGYRELAVGWRHGEAVGALPAIHADPFDRILVAQAVVEPMRLLTRDREVARYGGVVWPV